MAQPQNESLWYHLNKVPMPEESFGACKNARNCKNWKAILGNGYCVKCWDRGLDKGIRKSTKRMEEEGVENIREVQENKYRSSGGYRRPYEKRMQDAEGERTYSID